MVVWCLFKTCIGEIVLWLRGRDSDFVAKDQQEFCVCTTRSMDNFVDTICSILIGRVYVTATWDTGMVKRGKILLASDSFDFVFGHGIDCRTMKLRHLAGIDRFRKPSRILYAPSRLSVAPGSMLSIFISVRQPITRVAVPRRALVSRPCRKLQLQRHTRGPSLRVPLRLRRMRGASALVMDT